MEARPEDAETERALIGRALLGHVREQLGGRGALALLPFEVPRGHLHEPFKFRLTANGERVGFVICSSLHAPDIAHRASSRARGARQMLGEELGAAVVTPLFDGTVAERSYAVFAHLHPLRAFGSERLGRWLALPQLFAWLRGAARATKRDGDPVACATNLEHLATLDGLSADVLRATEKARARLQSGAFVPVRVLSHADLWQGNVLFDAAARLSTRPRIRLIDWASAQLEGAPVFDLLRTTISFRSKLQTLRDEFAEHARILDATPDDIEGHVLSALGCSGRHRENFPLDRYIGMVERCYRDCSLALGRLAAVLLTLGLAGLEP